MSNIFWFCAAIVAVPVWCAVACWRAVTRPMDEPYEYHPLSVRRPDELAR
jgi:hypothetical protein